MATEPATQKTFKGKNTYLWLCSCTRRTEKEENVSFRLWTIFHHGLFKKNASLLCQGQETLGDRLSEQASGILISCLVLLAHRKHVSEDAWEMHKEKL